MDTREPINQIRKSAGAAKLVAVIGTGVSLALTNGKNPALSWRGLVENGFEYGLKKGRITEQQSTAWKSQLGSDDIDDLLGAAEFMSRKLDAPKGEIYGRWLESVFADIELQNDGMSNAIRALQSAGVLLCTLNTTHCFGLPGITLADTGRVAAWMRREHEAILHLHGAWETPSTCILGIRDYETTVSDDFRDLIQRTLSSFGRLLFIGCGDTFADPNFTALIKWLREKLRTALPQHYALVRNKDVDLRHADRSWQGFVEPIGFGTDLKELPEFLLREFPTTTKTVAKRKARLKPPAAKERQIEVLKQYREFLIRDCGQMTLEGMRADMNTAQRRFDLERLFVPLEVLPTPPDFPPDDPDREQKLLKWEEENKEPLKFGNIFKKHKRLALLALPGGGKSLLLKRLAVAYADPERRDNCDDALPDIDMMPVLIRCREWKESIRRPISALLHEIPTMTAQPSLTGLDNALLPLLKKGRVLLLVDGLDEIHSDADRITFAENLERFLQEYSSIRVLVTSREAGFGLVAPSISRCCERWRVAPLSPEAIKILCSYWHRLMIGESLESTSEARNVADRLLQDSSLRRLAENPLLLTMLLVVKHGAGRLPPDRVSLYDRAVEVLLDTWNIRGHESLNLKEAVPQLACVAFELMRLGKQTATSAELLNILEEAREKVPQIRRYAKDAPDKFLKRVELRSGLLVEAGHQLEGSLTVPFYQFRHLTFQEHLAAVAAVGGNYIGYQKNDTVLSPLAPYLLAEEWKEVVPMAAVLARKQAEPMLSALVERGNALAQQLTTDDQFPRSNQKLPAAVARLVQCLAEEAEASPETLTRALQIIAQFARGCISRDNWQELSRGPYGEELIHQAWLLYSPMDWKPDSWIRNTMAVLLVLSKPHSYWIQDEARKEVIVKLESTDDEQVVQGLLTIAGFQWGYAGPLRLTRKPIDLGWLPLNLLERHLLQDRPAVWHAATWAWALARRDRFDSSPVEALPSMQVLTRLLTRWLHDDDSKGIAVFALSTILELKREYWHPKLTKIEAELVGGFAESEPDRLTGRNDNRIAALIVAFHARNVWPEDELARKIASWLFAGPARSTRDKRGVRAMLEQFDAGRAELKAAQANKKTE